MSAEGRANAPAAPERAAVPAIEVHDLTVAYRTQPVLWDVDLTVPSGVLMAIVGGLGTVAGPVLGAVLLKLSSEVFRNVFEQANLLIYGALLIVVILFMPEGLIGGFQKLFKSRMRKEQSASA